MRANWIRGFGLADLCAVLVILTLAMALGVPAVAHVPRLSKRDACALNLKSIGTAAKIYANDNNERWMIPAFARQAIDDGGIDYLAGNHVNPHPSDPGEVGFDRENESTRDRGTDPDSGSTAVSVTRAYWMLVRSGDAGVDQFICPASRDRVGDTPRLLDSYFDFEGYDNISYGYQVPFGPRDTRAREGADNRQPLAADKGPYYLNKFEPTFRVGSRNPVDYDDALGRWHRYNSPNHHGQGQNVLFSDGHVSFEDTPAVGIHGDNIYTLMTDEWDELRFNLIHGESPHFATVAEFPYPGQGAFGFGAGLHSSTDSLIYP